MSDQRIPSLEDYQRRVPSRDDPARSSTPDEPLVSIVTVVWNGERFLERTVESVAAQDYPNLEYLVVDGGSTDGTLDVVARNRQRIDFCVSEPDRGIYDAFNKGVALARGRLIKLLNADDELTPGSVRTAVAEHRAARRPVVVTSSLDLIDAEGQPLKRVEAERATNPVGPVRHPTWYVDRDIYQQHGLYDPSFRVAADYEMFLRLHRAGVEFRRCARPLVRFRSGGASSGLGGVGERFRITRAYFGAATATRTSLRHAVRKVRLQVLERALGERRVYAMRQWFSRPRD